MDKYQILLMVVCILIIVFCTISVKRRATMLYEKNKKYQTECVDTVKHDSETVESASKSNEKFYKKMVEMDRGLTLIFDGFPTCLTDILSMHKQPGEKIFSTKTDTLYLVDWDLNRADINKYPYYIVKDNHNNLWSLFRHNETFRLTREDEKKHKKLLEINPTTN